MSNYIEQGEGAEVQDWRKQELMNIPQKAMDYTLRRNTDHKVRALVQGSAIAYHDLIANTALMCQAELEERAAYFIHRNPQAAAHINELTTANMLYLRGIIFDPEEKW